MDVVMDKIAREQIELLIELQEKESIAAKMQRELDLLPGKIAEIESGLKEFEEAINTRKENLAELKKLYKTYDAEISLSNRENMKYPMLVGRRFMSQRYLVDVSHKYITKKGK